LSIINYQLSIKKKVMFKIYKSTLLLCLLTILTQAVTAQTYCLRYSLAKNNPVVADFNIGLKAGGTAFGLGAGNLQFKYNPKALANPRITSSALSQAGVYNGVTLTKPDALNVDKASDGLLSINFDFTGNTGTGLQIGLIGADVAVLRFDIIDSSLAPNFRPYDNGTAGTIVYNDNTATPLLLASTGSCEVYNTKVPIVIAKLNATPDPERPSVTIDWTTSFEKTGSYFIVERSYNGRPFAPIGNFLFATYTFKDLNPLKGFNKYRVKQIDPNGVESMSREVEVSLEKGLAINVYPTVVTELNGFITLDVPRPEALKRQDFRIFSVYGREWQRGKTGERIDIDVTRLPVGAYIIKVDDEQMKFYKQ
jgi:hypothetical protein